MHGHFNMIILKWSYQNLQMYLKYKFILNWSYKIWKRWQMLLNYTLNLKWWNYKWLFKEITSFAFKYFQKTEVYLEAIQTSKVELFAKTVDSLLSWTVFTKSFTFDVWLGCKNATKSFNERLFSGVYSDFNLFPGAENLLKVFPQNFHTRKFGEIKVFFAVKTFLS